MRVIRVDASLAGRLKAEEPASRWRAELLAAGLFAEPGEGPEPERQHLRALRRGVEEMLAAEAEIELRFHPIPWAAGGVPDAAWLLMAAVGGGLFLVAGLLSALMITPVLLGLFALSGLYLAYRQEQQRKAELARARLRRAQIGDALCGHLRGLSAGPFLLRLPGAVLVGSPELDRLEAQLRALYGNPAAETEAPPLRRRIAAAEQVLLRLRSLDPPEDSAVLAALVCPPPE